MIVRMKVFLIDGSSYIYRAFYAIRDLTNSKGEPTNAAFGFTNMLLKVVREHTPDAMLIALDSPHPTKRHAAYEHYKAQRPETPELLVRQIPWIRKIIEAFRIPVMEEAGYEADDLLASAADELAGDPDAEIFIITADKDMLQIVSDRVKILDPVKEVVIDSRYVLSKYGVPPERIPEFMALAGDAIDNIPGVRGIGDKTAREILQKAGSLEEILAEPDLAGTPRLARLIREHSDTIRLSHELAKLMHDAPVNARARLLGAGPPDWKSVLAIFRQLEFTSLLRYVPDSGSRRSAHELILSIPRLREVVAQIRDRIALKIEAADRNPVKGSIVGIALSTDADKGFYVPIAHTRADSPEQPPLGEVLRCLQPVLEDQGITKISHNIKHDVILLKKQGIGCNGMLLDTMIASHLLNPNKGNHSIEETVLAYLELKRSDLKELGGGSGNLADADLEIGARYCAEDATYALMLQEIVFEKLKSEDLMDVYLSIEMPLIRVLAEMELAGVMIDTNILGDLSRKLSEDLRIAESRIFDIAGRPFNINSPKQLSEILFQEIGLTPVKKTKTSFSTDTSVLEALSSVHALPREILNYRSLSKLKNTYVDPLPGLVFLPTGRLHTSFNQTVASTGRLSSSEPNLQNIPARGDWGRQIRQAFVAQAGNLLVSADYSQIELRILAHMSEDPRLIEAFMSETDIHAATAAEIFSVGVEMVTPEMRRIAKTVNFGIIYGISPFGLAETLRCSQEEAREYIDRYFSVHGGVRDFIDSAVSKVRKDGFAVTLFGRKRPIPDISSKNPVQRGQAERMAVNSPVQGTAADIIKIAMIRVAERFTSEPINARIILQVHDELLVECAGESVGLTCPILQQEMQEAATLKVPLRVDIGRGLCWAEAHQ